MHQEAPSDEGAGEIGSLEPILTEGETAFLSLRLRWRAATSLIRGRVRRT